MSDSDPLLLHVIARSKGSRQRLPGGLPFDIACAIVQELSSSYDYSALRACALVCRDWTFIAQQQLFRSVRISLQVTFDGTQPFPPTSLPQGDPLKKLLRFQDLLNGSPHLVRFVQHIMISSGLSASIRPTASLWQALQEVLTKTTRLRSLNLSDVNFLQIPAQVEPGLDPAHSFDTTQLDGPGQSPGGGPRIAIDRLDLWNCDFQGTRRAFFDLLRPFSRTRHLRLRRTKLVLGGSDPNLLPDLSASVIPVIEHITLHAAEEWWELDACGSILVFLHAALRASSITRTARGPSGPGALTTIRLRMAHPSALDRFLLPCLRDARAQLRELYLDVDFLTLFRDYENPAECWVALGLRLAACTALESLTLVVQGRPGPYGRRGYDVPYAEFLRTVLRTYARVVTCRPPPAVRSIVIRVARGFQKNRVVRDVLAAITATRSPGEHGEVDEHWGELDAALAAHRALERFAFTLDSWDVDDFEDRDGCMTEQDRARIAGALEAVLPRTAAKGLLSVELNSSPDAYCF